ncbi:hypothetical protein EDB87DRAFT_416165 [Lactarius vividus]|nr:hypothetical protein EDB87DRAFT_416165 [Lactarius vividus]
MPHFALDRDCLFFASFAYTSHAYHHHHHCCCCYLIFFVLIPSPSTMSHNSYSSLYLFLYHRGQLGGSQARREESSLVAVVFSWSRFCCLNQLVFPSSPPPSPAESDLPSGSRRTSPWSRDPNLSTCCVREKGHGLRIGCIIGRCYHDREDETSRTT